jgi:hypothetical protein
MKDSISLDSGSLGILKSSGIDDSQIHDGNIVWVNCCGGPTEEATRTAFYIPDGISVEVGDFVEVKLGQTPDKEHGFGKANMATRVVQKSTTQNSQCRWEPQSSHQWGRVLYCDWMPSQGWVNEGQRATIHKAWIKLP